MSPFPFPRGRVHRWVITSTWILSVGVVSMWNRPQAAGSNDRALIGVSSVGAFTPEKGSLTPQAATIVVNSLSDVVNASDGSCTLREAITAANNNVASGAVAGECAAGTATGADTIDLTKIAGTITLTSALPNINSDIMLIGPGPTNLTVRRSTAVGTPDFSIFSVGGGIVSISGVTVSGGRGSGISNVSVLTITNTTVTGSQCVASGSISNGIGSSGPNSVLNVVNSTVSGNSCDHGAGYGIHLAGNITGEGVATIANSIITGNNSSDPVNPGGGIVSDAPGGTGLVTVINSTVAGNMGPGIRSGGGVLSIADSTIRDNVGGGLSVFGQVTVASSTISGNTALSAGGIINFATLTLLNSTISGNKTTGGPGGGIYNRAVVTSVNCTIANNTAATTGGGVYNERFRTFSFNFRNTIIANNQAGSGTGFDVGGPDAVTSQDYNLIGNNAGSSITGVTTHNIVNADPKLGPLADNGGPTMTHALLQNSPALDAGDNCVTDVAHCGDSTIPQLVADQRSFSRMIDGPDADQTATVDIGAYELQPALANLVDVTTNEDSQLLVGFDPGDTSTINSLTATSSNTTLVPNDSAHLTIGIHGSSGVITINPAVNQFGTTNIAVNLNRTGGPETKTFLLTVNSVNDPPSFQLVGPDQIIN